MPEANLGAQMIREAAERTGEAVGDGVSTSAILAHAIFSEGLHTASLRKLRCDARSSLGREESKTVSFIT
jgi:chaperonin GroEL